MKKYLLMLCGLILTSFIISGCTLSPKHIKSVKPSHEHKTDTGIIYGTLSKTGGSDGWIFIRKKGEKKETRIDAVGFGSGKDIRSGMTRGNLFVKSLEPGTYEITNWMLFVYQGSYSYYYLSPKSPPKIEFQVSPGEAVYLGSFNIQSIFGKNVFGLPITVDARGNIRDQLQRDTAIFNRKYPKLRHLPVRHSVPDATVWLNLPTKRD